MKVYVVIIEWNRKGDASWEIQAVCGNREKAREIMTEEVENDLQFSDFENVEGMPSMVEITTSIMNKTPLPTDYLKLSNGNPDSCEDYIEYSIMETNFYE